MSVRTTSVCLAAACATLLAGCAVGPDFKRPEPPQAQTYTNETRPAGQSSKQPGVGGDIQRVTLGQNPGPQWWKAFKSDALDKTVERALASNRSLAAAVLSVQQ